DERERLYELVTTRRSHDSGLHHRGMLGERTFDLGRRHPHAARFDHVVAAAGVPEAAVGIAPVLVTRPHPLAHERLLRALVLVPVAGAGAVALDEQIADFALGHVTPVVIHDPGIVARHQRAARAGAHVPAPVRDERMTQFGRPDP